MGLNLHLVLKRRWYDDFEQNMKTVEYRDDTPYWRKRIVKKWDPIGSNRVTFHRAYTSTTITFNVDHVLVNRFTEKIEIHVGARLN